MGSSPRVLKTTLPAGDPRSGQNAWCAQQICSSTRDRPTVSGYVMTSTVLAPGLNLRTMATYVSA